LKRTPQPLRDSEENGLELKAVSQFEIASDKRIYQHLSELASLSEVPIAKMPAAKPGL
jgi:hypothetical protein